ncbi:LuxR C-terminal-related transcriptional regulator [Actinomycetospora aeridis]|uniref:LuxR C-terminal-related transcriptional regulator n=1 Tax=Actinomycetospora aeridis TaxID=3129231 RepID=A0ABU8N9U4_9PSEU
MVRIPASRTAVPALPTWLVPRPALWRHLAAARPGQLVALIAPAGSGKTVLLAEWARHGDGPPTAWASLDRDDADPDRFWSVVLAAVLATGAVPADHPLRHLSGRDATGDDLADALLEGLGTLCPRIRLVLDDVHVLADRQAGVRALARLVRHRPAGVDLVLAARSDPAVGLPRLRLEDGLRELRAEGLRFSVDATAALAAASGVALEADDVDALHRRTEGWAAGLRLAVLALRSGEGPEGPLLDRFSGDDRSVADYLGGELLDGLAPDDRELLDDLSVCRRLPDALAVALTGRHDVVLRLEELGHGLGMVDRAGPGEHHVHALLRFHLAADLARRRPERHRQQHATAARWWAGHDDPAHDDPAHDGPAHDDPAHALHHAERAGDPALTAELLERLAVPLLQRGELPALRRALDLVGAAVVDADPRLALVAALVHLDAREHAAAAARMRVAARAWPAAPGPSLTALRAAAELLAGSVGIGSGDPARTASPEPDDAGLAGLLHLARGTALLAASPANTATARTELHRALVPARTDRLVRLEVAAFGELALAAVAEGDAGGVTGPGEAALDRGGPPSRTARTAALLAWSDLLRGDPGRAAGRCADVLGLPGRLAPADRYALHAVHGAAAGDLGRRGAGLTEARDARIALGDAPLPAPLAGALALLEHRGALRLGNLRVAGEVVGWLAGRLGGEGDETVLLRARAEAATGRWESASAAVAPLRRPTPACPPATVVVEAALLETEAALRADDAARGRAALATALAVGRDRDLVRPFALAGPRTRVLLLGEPAGTGHAGRVAAACAAVTDAPAPPLSERELVVLALLPSLLDAPTMADELVVSVNTVKTQIRSIYAKLGVSSRRGAVTEAQERGLLV